MKSIFTPLKAEGLTTLKINYDYKTNHVRFFCAKEWEADMDFSGYNKDFYAESVLTDKAKFLNTEEVYAMYDKYDLRDQLEAVLDLIRKGKHFAMECFYNDKYNIRYMCNEHSRVRGINNSYHAVIAGGIRRHGFEDSELDVVVDGLNLGRAMSFKCIAAGLDFGGCKTTVHMEPLDLENMDMMGFISYALDRTRCMTGPDMNFPTEMADVMRDNFTLHINGAPSSPLGETGKPTAYGCYIAMKEAERFRTGSADLRGTSVAVMGLGAVGWYMAGHLIDEGAKLFVNDINKDRVKKLFEAYPNADITEVEGDILDIEADILCPCAIGGIIHEGNIPNLKFKSIFGPGNNQLRASSQEEEFRLAKMLADRGILFQTEWWHNCAGVLCGAEDYYYANNATYENLIKKIDKILPSQTWENLNRAKEQGITPTESAYNYCQELIYRHC